MQKKSYHPPELSELGHLRDLVKLGDPKTGPDGDGSSPEPRTLGDAAPINDDFSRSSRSSDSSGGRSGRN